MMGTVTPFLILCLFTEYMKKLRNLRVDSKLQFHCIRLGLLHQIIRGII